jgi:hypothetical protein
MVFYSLSNSFGTKKMMMINVVVVEIVHEFAVVVRELVLDTIPFWKMMYFLEPVEFGMMDDWNTASSSQQQKQRRMACRDWCGCYCYIRSILPDTRFRV